MKIRSLIPATIIALGLVLIAFCSASGAAEDEVVPYPDAMTGKQAPPFSLQGLYGEKFNLADLLGSPVVLIFGTSW